MLSSGMADKVLIQSTIVSRHGVRTVRDLLNIFFFFEFVYVCYIEIALCSSFRNS